jgi:hypothetical protein
MKDCDSRSWIGGEGLPSRDQVKEKREQRSCRWVSVRGSHKESVVSYKAFRTGFLYMYMYMGFSGDSHVHMWVC